jgi:hypothetical protein
MIKSCVGALVDSTPHITPEGKTGRAGRADVEIFGVLKRKKATVREADTDPRRSSSTSRPSLGLPHWAALAHR